MELLAPLAIHLDSEKSRQVLGKALRRLQETWQFNNTEMATLLRVKPNTYGYWMKKEELPFQSPPYSAEMELVLVLFSVFRSLGAMFVSASDQLIWLKSVHPDFAGESPLDFAKKSSENLFYLKQYLEYVRGRGA